MQTRSSPSLATLHSLARRAAIPDYNKLSKSELYSCLQGQFNINRLLRAEARGSHSHESIRVKRSREDLPDWEKQGQVDASSASSKKKLKPNKAEINKLDPIMLEPIQKDAFYFIRPNGSIVAFNVESLVDYLLAAGEFYDPETRLPFSDTDLKAIDMYAKKAGLTKNSVYEAKENAARLYADLRFRRDALLGLERCAGELINEIMSIIEEGDADAELQLLLRVFPSFSDLFQQIKDADKEFAAHCMSHWLTFIKGPPNKPNTDYFGLMPIILQFLETCQKA